MSSRLESLFSASALQRISGRAAYERGERYATTRRVTKSKVSEVEASATVKGTSSYRVRLWVDQGIPRSSCTCPMGEQERFCKHSVAVGLMLADRPAGTGGAAKGHVRPDLRGYLRGLTIEALVDLVVDQAERDELLRGRLLLEAAKGQSRVVNIDSFRHAIEEAIVVEDFVDWRSMYDYSRGIDEVIDVIERLYKDGHAAEVVELCEHALGCLEDAMSRFDDSDGYSAGIGERLRDLHHRACRKARSDPKALAARLFEWELHGEWEMFYGAATSYADVLGKKGLATYRRLADQVWADIPSLEPNAQREHSSFRFNITHIMESLAALSNDVDELIAVKSRDLSVACRFVEIAEICKKAKRFDQLLDWAERGAAAFPTNTDIRLREVLADEYHRRRRHADAMAVIWAAYVDRPLLDVYQRLKSHAVRASGWDEWRGKALDLLRSEKPPRTRRPSAWEESDGSVLVSVLLWEGEHETAWEEACSRGCSERLWMELAATREKDRPLDTIPIYQRHVDELVGRKNNDAYAEAVDWIKRIGRLMRAAGTGEAYPPYVATIRAAHKPKRNLMKLLDRAKL